MKIIPYLLGVCCVSLCVCFPPAPSVECRWKPDPPVLQRACPGPLRKQSNTPCLNRYPFQPALKLQWWTLREYLTLVGSFLRGGDRSSSDPLPCLALLGGDWSESEPWPFWAFLGGDWSESEPGRDFLLGGDWSESLCLPFKVFFLGGDWSLSVFPPFCIFLRGGDWSKSESCRFGALVESVERFWLDEELGFFLTGEDSGEEEF